MSEDLQAQIAQHREDLAETVQLLAAKLDVRSRATHRFQELRPTLLKVGAGAAAVAVVVLTVRRVRR